MEPQGARGWQAGMEEEERWQQGRGTEGTEGMEGEAWGSQHLELGAASQTRFPFLWHARGFGKPHFSQDAPPRGNCSVWFCPAAGKSHFLFQDPFSATALRASVNLRTFQEI